MGWSQDGFKTTKKKLQHGAKKQESLLYFNPVSWPYKEFFSMLESIQSDSQTPMLMEYQEEKNKPNHFILSSHMCPIIPVFLKLCTIILAHNLGAWNAMMYLSPASMNWKFTEFKQNETNFAHDL